LESVRSFIAVPASQDVRDLVGEVVGGLKWIGADVKWVEPENVHITLKFLGGISPESVERLGAVLHETLAGYRAFDMALAKTGCFPSGRRPRVVWMGFEQGVDGLKDIAAAVESACAGLGFEREERPFRAHLTIGRVRRESGKLRELAEGVAAVTFKPLKLRVDRVNLVRSRLSPKGPTYTVMESVALADS
jgi:2'-5' RNA ligase